MFEHMMVPVDLAQPESLEKALSFATKLAKDHDIPITYVGVGASAPTAVARSPQEFRNKLEAFAVAQGEARGLAIAAHSCIINDPTAETDDALLQAVGDIGADLVVMASHVPGWAEYIWSSNGGKIASHAKCSVMIIRP